MPRELRDALPRDLREWTWSVMFLVPYFLVIGLGCWVGTGSRVILGIFLMLSGASALGTLALFAWRAVRERRGAQRARDARGECWTPPSRKDQV